MAALSVDTGLTIEMRDGVRLGAHLVRPAGPGRFPALLFRTPYDRSSFASVSLQVHALRMAEAGYAVVLQDVRGRYGSGGEFAPFVAEGADGVDTITWIAGRPWCDGSVGTVGMSYTAFCQLAAAAAAPEPLRAWMPALTPFDVRTSWIRRDGAFNYGFNLAWMLGAVAASDPRTPDPEGVGRALSRPEEVAARDPLHQPELAASPATAPYFRWLEQPDPYPGRAEVPGRGDLGRVPAPALVVAGWYDVFSHGSIDLLAALRSEAPGHPHRLVAGPWDHTGLPFKRRTGDLDHGPGALLDYHALQLAWFDAHLRGADPPPPGDRVFVTGAGEWAHLGGWPAPARVRSMDLGVDGTMGPDAGAGEVVIDLDAGRPTPSLGGRVFPWEPLVLPGAFDQEALARRSDVAVFTSEPMHDAVRVVGGASVETVVAAPSGGTDVVVTLCDVDLSGRAWNVADGVRRIPGGGPEPTACRISLGHLAHEFRRGHRVRVMVAAAAFGRYDVFGGSGTRVLLAGPGYSRLVWDEAG